MKSAYNERFSFHDPKQSACRSTRHRATKRKATEWPRPREYDDSDSEPTDDAVTIIPEWEYDNMETGVILETTIDNLEGNQDSRKVVHWGIAT